MSFHTYKREPYDTLNLTSYTAVVIFGASDCDDAHPRPQKYNNTLRGRPYFNGRFTNGPVFGEYLKKGILTGKNITLLNYAYGDATVSNTLVNVAAPDTASQTHSYINDVTQHRVHREGVNGQGRVLHIFWIGINDVVQIWQDVITNGTFSNLDSLTTNPYIADRSEKHFTIARHRINAEVAALMSQVSMIRKNQEVNKIPGDLLILTLPPLEMLPNLFYHSRELASNFTLRDANLASSAKIYQRFIGELTAKYNRTKIKKSFPKGIAAGIESLLSDARPQVNEAFVLSGRPTFTRTFDTVGLWHYVHANPTEFNFENVIDACWNSTTGGICNHPDQYQYWDTLHPTTAMHRFLAQDIAMACN
ncbi:uncharacterized protein MELLADRAFT_85285 [Melampsora larici-populina 98AG31]|uniref:Carbohydrate esterase family 16 protein n=1 Tax=Melampsora larici-populina (strain 98AG31 / pathotype 3-4-7) TaxID=747676 RepID=F4RI83_MELLP|nr:uncharacterized protein MELLADRAFT_85285 [Melampsora larici-populina 98AG31]EGG07961.1 hypothetical protein MELLADRAFT_85285 [Melampsora larici-populina 98AG31]